MTPIPPDHTEVARLVVRTPNWLGDAVLALPALAALRKHFKNAHLTIATPAGFAPVFREDTDARPDAILELPSAHKSVPSLLKAGQFDLGVLLPNSFRSAWLLRQAGVPQRWGYATAVRGWMLTKTPVRIPVHGVQHQADYYRAMVRGLGIPCGDEAPRLRATSATWQRAVDLLQKSRVDLTHRLAVLAPGAAYGQAKQWPPDRVAQLVARLVRERDMTCVMVGAGHDRDAARAVESWLSTNAPDTRSRVTDLTGRTSLAELIGVLAKADVVVANDSGAMHVAAALGRPMVAIFGPTDERATRPVGPYEVMTAKTFCRPCHLRDCPIDHRCMKRISADAVFSAVSNQLAFRRS
jgi:heptosyltransferase-2